MAKNTTKHPVTEELTSLKAICREAELNYTTVRGRLAKGESLSYALRCPVLQRQKIELYDPATGEKCNWVELGRRYNISPETLKDRVLDWGWAIEDAVSTPPKPGVKEKMLNKKYIYIDPDTGEETTLNKLCRRYNQQPNVVTGRLGRGWTLKQALEEPKVFVCGHSRLVNRLASQALDNVL